MGLDTSMQLIMSGVLNIVQLVGVTTSIWTMDVVGRRKLLLGGAVLMAISHVIIAALVGIYSVDWPSHKAQGWTSVAFLLFYMLAFGATWGPIPWAMPSGTYFDPFTMFTRHQSDISRNLPFFPSRQGCCSFNLLQLAQQLYHCKFLITILWPLNVSSVLIISEGPHHPAPCPRHGLRCLRLLRRLLLARRNMDLLLCARDQRSNPRADGPCVQRQF